MKQEEFIKKLFEIKEKYPDWEENEKAWDFGMDVWIATEDYISSKQDIKILSQDDLASQVFSELKDISLLKHFLTDDLRRLVIRYHARNKSTTDAVLSILRDERMKPITPFYLFKHSNVCGFENIKSFLVARLGYLKPSDVRWPEKKYGKYWCEARAEFVDNIQNIPLSQPEEQLQKLSEHYQELENAYREADKATDKERFHKCMLRTMAAIHLITRDPRIKASDVPEITQESRTQALPSPNDEQILDIPNSVVVDSNAK